MHVHTLKEEGYVRALTVLASAVVGREGAGDWETADITPVRVAMATQWVEAGGSSSQGGFNTKEGKNKKHWRVLTTRPTPHSLQPLATPQIPKDAQRPQPRQPHSWGLGVQMHGRNVTFQPEHLACLLWRACLSEPTA